MPNSPSKRQVKKVPQKYKDFVKDCAQKAAWSIGVSHYRIDIHYMDEAKDSDGETNTRGEMETDKRYLQGTMRLYPKVLAQWEKGEINQVKEVVYHEIAHLATQHFYDVATSIYKDEGETKDAWETCTEVIGRLALKIDELENK